MTILRNSEIQTIHGNEGTYIKQYFHPHNTLNGISYSIAHFSLEPNKETLLYKLTSSEIYYILEGRVVFIMGAEESEIRKDDSIYVTPNAEQKIRNTGADLLKFLCIVEPAWTHDCEKSWNSRLQHMQLFLKYEG